MTAISNPEDCKKNKKLSKKINIDFVKGLVKILIELKIYFIFFSSEYVYSGLNKSYLKYNENSKIGTKMIYGKQKIEIEKFLQKIKYKNYSVLRLAKTFGDTLNDGTLFTNILKKYGQGQKNFSIASDQFFCPVYINDVVKIIDILVKKINGTYNVCGVYKSRYDFIKMMCDVLKIKDIELKKCSLRKFDNRIYYPKKLNLSNLKIKKKLKFKFNNFKNVIRNFK